MRSILAINGVFAVVMRAWLPMGLDGRGRDGNESTVDVCGGATLIDIGGSFEISSGGRGTAQLTTMPWAPQLQFVGQFDKSTAAADLLVVNWDRMGHKFSPGLGIIAHGLYAY